MKAFILVILDLMYKFLIYSDIFYFKDYSKFLFLFFEKINKLNKLKQNFVYGPRSAVCRPPYTPLKQFFKLGLQQKLARNDLKSFKKSRVMMSLKIN